MEMRAIGSIAVPLSGIGCNNFGRRIDEERSREVIDAAYEVGATLFDTADLYGDTASEEFLGRALKGRRDEAVSDRKAVREHQHLSCGQVRGDVGLVHLGLVLIGDEDHDHVGPFRGVGH